MSTNNPPGNNVGQDVGQGIRNAGDAAGNAARNVGSGIGSAVRGTEGNFAQAGSSFKNAFDPANFQQTLNLVLKAIRTALDLPKILFAVIASFLWYLVLSLIGAGERASLGLPFSLGGVTGVPGGINGVPGGGANLGGLGGSFSIIPTFIDWKLALFNILTLLLFAIGYAIIFGTVVKMCVDEMDSGRKTTWQSALGYVFGHLAAFVLAPLVLAIFYLLVVLVEELVGLLLGHIPVLSPILGYILFIPLIIFNVILVVSVYATAFLMFPAASREGGDPISVVQRGYGLARRAIGPVVLFGIIYLLLYGVLGAVLDRLVGYGTDLTGQVYAAHSFPTFINYQAYVQTGDALTWAVGAIGAAISALLLIVLPAAAGSALFLDLAPKYPPLPKPVRAPQPAPYAQQPPYGQSPYGQQPQQPPYGQPPYGQPPQQPPYGQPPPQPPYGQQQAYSPPNPPPTYGQPGQQYSQPPYTQPPPSGASTQPSYTPLPTPPSTPPTDVNPNQSSGGSDTTGGGTNS